MTQLMAPARALRATRSWFAMSRLVALAALVSGGAACKNTIQGAPPAASSAAPVATASAAAPVPATAQPPVIATAQPTAPVEAAPPQAGVGLELETDLAVARDKEKREIERWKQNVLLCFKNYPAHGEIGEFAATLFRLAERIVDDTKSGKMAKAEDVAAEIGKYLKSLMQEKATEVKFMENLPRVRFTEGEVVSLLEPFSRYLKGWSPDCLEPIGMGADREELAERAERMRGVLKPASVDKFTADVQAIVLANLPK